MFDSSDVVTRGSDEERRAVIATLYSQHFRSVWRWLSALGVREADLEDAIHDVFLAAYQGLDGFEGRSQSLTWLFGIASNVASNRRRRAYLRREVHDDQADAPSAPERGPEREAEVGQARVILERILDALTEEQRVVFVLHELVGHTGAVIAELTGAPLQTVYSRLRAARDHVERESAREAGQGPVVIPMKRSS